MPPAFQAPILLITATVAAAVASTLPGLGAQSLAQVGGPGFAVDAGGRARVAYDAEVLVGGRAAELGIAEGDSVSWVAPPSAPPSSPQ